MTWIAVTILVALGCTALAVRRPMIGLIAGPVTFLFVLVALITGGHLAAAGVSPAVLLGTLAAVILGRPEPDGCGQAHLIARWVLIVLGILLALVIATLMPFGYIFGVLYVITFAAVMLGALFASRRAVADDVIATLAAAVRQNLPLSDALAAAAQGRGGKRSEVLRRIAAHLTEGAPLSHAIREGFPACPGYVQGMISVAERSGQLSAAVVCLQKDAVERRTRRAVARPMHPWYPLLVLGFSVGALLFLSGFVFPKYAKIYQSFGIQMPALTQYVFDLAGAIGYGAFAGLAGLVWLLILAGGVVAIYVPLRSRHPERPRFLSVVGDWLKWRLPAFRWFERNYSLLHTVEYLRLALEAGHPIDDAVSAARDLDVNYCFRKKLTRWRDRILRGEDVADAARKSGMGRPVAWAFDQKTNPGRAPEVLASLETFYRGNYSYWSQLLRSVLWPCVSIALALLVGLVVLAVFLPIPKLIEGTMGP